MRVQLGSATRHAEIVPHLYFFVFYNPKDCLENAGRLKATQYAKATLYSTLSCCDMCSGAALLYKIPKIVIGVDLNSCSFNTSQEKTKISKDQKNIFKYVALP